LYERILVPLDGSESAQLALPYAEKLAGRLGSRITFIYVIESADDKQYQMHQLDLQKIVEATKSGIEVYLDERGGKEVKVDAVILTGNPAEEIVNYSDKENIGLIVMSTHGRSGIKRWAMGSVADKVLRATAKPLALIRGRRAEPGASEKGMLNKILATLDGSKQSEAVIPYVEELASKLKTEVIVLQVVAPDYHIYTAGGPEYGVYSEQQIDSARAFARDYLERIVASLKEKGIAAMSHVMSGTATDEIIKFADASDIGLVAMITHGRSGVSRWALGSVAERVLRAGNAPLLLIRAPGAITE